jgi:UDP-N-acetylglucosamine--N-acetylmuramyl-(pentapeptide) pyrophosphoryl-undecaprenol N-acetylglucosamine transferase
MSIRAPGRTPGGWLRYCREVVVARQQILSVLKEGFQVAFGLGGYSSVPGILAARKVGIPVILLEQNRVPGRVNRLLAPLVEAITFSYPETRVRFCRRGELTGNPVRRDVLDAAPLRASWPDPSGKRNVLVVGGSQGARGINHAIRDALPLLSHLRGRIRLTHVTGDADKSSMQETYRMHGWEAEVLAYCPNLPGLMARSDLFLGRAGGTTLAELAVMGLPSILVPYPYHKDNHQLLNAQFFERAGGARILVQSQLGGESLRRVFEDVLLVPKRLEAMGKMARNLARPEASDTVLNLALGLSRQCPPVSASLS